MIPLQPSFKPVQPQDLNRVITAINNGLDITAAPPLEVRKNAGKTQLILRQAGFMGAIISVTDGLSSSSSSASSSSGSSGGPSARYSYAVQEVQVEANGLWEYVMAGRVVTPSYEWNDTLVSVGTVVFVQPFGTDWRFDASGGGGCSPDVDDVLTDAEASVDGCEVTITFERKRFYCNGESEILTPLITSFALPTTTKTVITAINSIECSDGSITIDYDTETINVLDCGD